MDVSILGAGNMGRALARALARSGYEVTVWIRTPASAMPQITHSKFALIRTRALLFFGECPV